MSAAPVSILFGGYQPPASVHNRAADVLADELASRLGDEVAFRLEGNVMESGHKAADLLDMVAAGTMTMCYFSASYLAGRVPEFALLDLPFTFTERDRAYAVFDGPLGTRLADRLREATGFRLLGLWDNGFRHFTNNLRPIRTPEDCRGMRIRTLFSELHIETFKALGFDPVSLDVRELIAGIDSGDIIAQENPLTNTYNFGIYEKHRYITLSSHFFGAAAVLCHAASFEAWPADVQTAVLEAVAAATAAQRRFAAAEDDDVLARLAETDNEIIRLTAAERSRFRDAVAPVIDEQRRNLGDRLFQFLE